LVYEKQDFRIDKLQLRLTEKRALCCIVVRHGLKKKAKFVFLGQLDEEALQQLKTNI
jgi:hypothetical protein